MSTVYVNLCGRKHHDLFVLIDEEDEVRVRLCDWSAHFNGPRIYAKTSWQDTQGKSHKLLLHRFLMNAPPGVLVDHINGNGLDNRRSVNLRFATHAENMRNRRKHKTGQCDFKGVFIDDSSPVVRWRARVRFEGNAVNLGSYRSPEAAARAYDAKAGELFGEFASLNFPRKSKATTPDAT